MYYSILRFSITGLLLFSAIMKAHQTITEPAQKFPWFEIVSVEYEFLLALLLLLGIFPKIVRLITIGTFLLFSVITVRLIWISAESCGCFGSLHVDPRMTLCLDLLVVLSLIFAKVPAPMKFPTKWQCRLFGLGVLLSFIPLLAMGRPHPPTIVEHSLVSQEKTKRKHDFGYVEPLSVHRFAFEIINPTDRDWRILSVKTECDCLVALESPELVKANEKQVLPMEFHVPKEKQHYVKKIIVATDDPEFLEIVYTIDARIGLPLKLVPGHIVFDMEHPGKEQQKIITVINDGTLPVKLLYSKASPAIAFAKIPKDPVPAKGTLELPIVFRIPKETNEIISLDLIIQTSCAEQRTLVLSVRAESNTD